MHFHRRRLCRDGGIDDQRPSLGQIGMLQSQFRQLALCGDTFGSLIVGQLRQNLRFGDEGVGGIRRDRDLFGCERFVVKFCGEDSAVQHPVSADLRPVSQAE